MFIEVGVNPTLRPLYPPPRNDPVPVEQEAKWATGPVRENSHPPGFEIRAVQPEVSCCTD